MQVQSPLRSDTGTPPSQARLTLAPVSPFYLTPPVSPPVSPSASPRYPRDSILSCSTGTTANIRTATSGYIASREVTLVKVLDLALGRYSEEMDRRMQERPSPGDSDMTARPGPIDRSSTSPRRVLDYTSRHPAPTSPLPSVPNDIQVIGGPLSDPNSHDHGHRPELDFTLPTPPTNPGARVRHSTDLSHPTAPHDEPATRRGTRYSSADTAFTLAPSDALSSRGEGKWRPKYYPYPPPDVPVDTSFLRMSITTAAESELPYGHSIPSHASGVHARQESEGGSKRVNGEDQSVEKSFLRMTMTTDNSFAPRDAGRAQSSVSPTGNGEEVLDHNGRASLYTLPRDSPDLKRTSVDTKASGKSGTFYSGNTFGHNHSQTRVSATRPSLATHPEERRWSIESDVGSEVPPSQPPGTKKGKKSTVDGSALPSLNEVVDGEDSDADDQWRMDSVLPARNQREKHMSKVDRMLGDGAAAAGERVERNRRTLKESIEKSVVPKTPVGPVPPRRTGHKASASVPLYHLSSPHSAIEHRDQAELLASPVLHTGIHGRPRSNSIDSAISLHPSIADSITRLLPLTHPLSPGTHSPFNKALPNVPSISKEDLSIEQRQRLLRSMKALEKRLGESLTEDITGGLVVGPSQGSPASTFLHDNGQDSHEGGGSKTAKNIKEAFGLEKKIKDRSLGRPGNSRNGSYDSTRLKGEGVSSGSSLESTRRGGREMKVSPRSDGRPLTPTGRGEISDLFQSDTSPPKDWFRDNQDGSWPEGDGDSEAVRRMRRRQISKLNKWLGTVVSPDTLASAADNAQQLQRHQALRAPLPGSRLAYPDSPSGFINTPSPSDDVSFMHFDDASSFKDGLFSKEWTVRLKERIGNKRLTRTPTPLRSNSQPASGVASQQHSRENSGDKENVKTDQYPFFDMRTEAAGGMDTAKSSGRDGTNLGLSEGERTQARKRAQKLSQVFGVLPPLEMYHPAYSTKGDTPSNTFRQLNQSLQGLLYLAENDPGQLAKIVDRLSVHDGELEDPIQNSESAHVSPQGRTSSPVRRGDHAHDDNATGDKCCDDDDEDMAQGDRTDTTSRAARRRRTEKLSQFFGETNFDSTPPPPTLSQPSGANRPTTAKGLKGTMRRMDTYDGILAEIRKSVQVEAWRGRLRLDEVDRLGEAMRALKREREAKSGVWAQL